jgi:hypothetical protein
MKNSDIKQLELECDGEQPSDVSGSDRNRNAELMRRIDKVISDTTTNVRPYLNQMVKDMERLLEDNFIRTPGSNLLDDIIAGLEKDMRKFVKEVMALKQWNRPSPPRSSMK